MEVSMNPSEDIRPSPIAGTWYSGSQTRLSSQIDEFCSQAKPASISGKVIALLAPHAGHVYSGLTAAYAYKTVEGNTYDLVIIVSPSHGYYPQAVITSAHREYATPLGRVPVHQQALAAFSQTMEELHQEFAGVRNDNEHSIEIQLPFLQRVLKGNFQLLPIMMRAQDWQTVQRVEQGIAPLMKQYHTLLVASSDLSHFYPEDIADQLDETMLHQVELFSPQGVLKAEEDGSGSACGAGPIAVVLAAASQVGADQVKILHHSTSADVTGDRSSVVGYGAAVVTSKK